MLVLNDKHIKHFWNCQLSSVVTDLYYIYLLLIEGWMSYDKICLPIKRSNFKLLFKKLWLIYYQVLISIYCKVVFYSSELPIGVVCGTSYCLLICSPIQNCSSSSRTPALSISQLAFTKELGRFSPSCSVLIYWNHNMPLKKKLISHPCGHSCTILIINSFSNFED